MTADLMRRVITDPEKYRAWLDAYLPDIPTDTGVAAVSDEHYSGSHWLASFATYLMTDRGWND